MNIPSWCDHYVSLPYDEVNCWGLVMLVYKEMYGIDLPKITEQRELMKTGFWTEVQEDFQTGDVILFKSAIVERHVGIFLDDQYMLHADRHAGTVIERWKARVWVPRFQGIYRCSELN